MAEMLIQSENLVAIADKIRVLSGTEEAMSLSVMESYIGEANTEVATQVELIAQIANALDGKNANSQEEYTTLLIKSNGSSAVSLYDYELASYVPLDKSEITIKCGDLIIIKNNVKLMTTPSLTIYGYFNDQPLNNITSHDGFIEVKSTQNLISIFSIKKMCKALRLNNIKIEYIGIAAFAD